MTKVVQLKRSHLEQMHRLGKMPSEQPISEAQFEDFTMDGWAYALIDDGIVLGAGGIWPVWDGVGEAWAIITEDLKKRPLLLHKTVSAYLEKLRVENNLHRVQCIVLCGFIKAESWAHALGFIHEGIMHEYGPTRLSYHRFARIYDG